MTARQNGTYRMAPAGNTDKSENERRQSERRETKSDGFAYISTVGWICRREQCRRNYDKLFV